MSQSNNNDSHQRSNRLSVNTNSSSTKKPKSVPKKVIRKKSLLICHGCLEEFQFDSHRGFLRNHQLKDGSATFCRESVFPCKDCNSSFYSADGVERQFTSCTPGRKRHNNQVGVDDNVRKINASQFEFGNEGKAFSMETCADTATFVPHYTNNQQNLSIIASQAEEKMLSSSKRRKKADTNSTSHENQNNQINLETQDAIPVIHHLDRNIDTDLDENLQAIEFNMSDEFSDQAPDLEERVPEISPETLMEMKKVMKQNIVDTCFDVNFVAAVELEVILHRAGSPLSLFDDILNWGLRNVDNLPKKLNPLPVRTYTNRQLIKCMELLIRP